MVPLIWIVRYVFYKKPKKKWFILLNIIPLDKWCQISPFARWVFFTFSKFLIKQRWLLLILHVILPLIIHWYHSAFSFIIKRRANIPYIKYIWQVIGYQRKNGITIKWMRVRPYDYYVVLHYNADLYTCPFLLSQKRPLSYLCLDLGQLGINTTLIPQTWFSCGDVK